MFDYLKAVYGLYVPQAEVETEELEGQGMVEYGLILALVSIVAVVALIAVGDEIVVVFESIVDDLGTGGSGETSG